MLHPADLDAPASGSSTASLAASDGVGTDASIRYLLGRLALVEARVRHVVDQRREVDPEPDDPVRGLYISEDQVDRLLGEPTVVPPFDTRRQAADLEQWAHDAERRGADVRLRRLARTFGLDPLDVEILLIAMAPDLDPRFERLYGYLHDDITRRRAGVGLVFELLGLAPAGAAARARVAGESRLVGGGLLSVTDADRPFLTRALQVHDRVIGHLLGDDTPTQQVAAVAIDVPVVAVAESTEVARSVAAGAPVVYIRESARTAGLAAGVSGLAEAGRATLAVDLSRAGRDADGRALLADVVREAALQAAGLVAGPIDELVERDPQVLDGIRHAGVPVVVVGRRAWDPAWLAAPPVTVVPGALDPAGQARLWREVATQDVGFDVAEATLQFRLKPEQVVRAWQSARLQATAAGRRVSADDLRIGARLQNAGRLEHLARRIAPRARYDDLVLPDRVGSLLDEIVQRARHRGQVLGAWGMGGRSDKGRGITALFAGGSGTGKTLSAEVVAHQLGLDLYVIDLSTVVDKYIGETEKNLERIFDQAEDVNGILFFDEADALFGKRSEVSDAKDRYANVEIAYLLQRMEHFDGITVLATNLRANLDDAFTRRIDVLIDFPEPEPADRRRLWELHLPEALPRGNDLDLDFLAERFELSGGDIRNVTLAAAYAAAVESQRVTMDLLVRATAREYRKLGRLLTASEFGPWFDRLVAPAPVAGGEP